MKGRGNSGAAAAAAGAATFRQLEALGIPYDELLFGKPHADVYVDSRAVSPRGGSVERSLGWAVSDLDLGVSNSDLAGGVAPRHFNAVRRVGDGHVEKTGPRSVLRGEIYWYKHVPEALRDLFPKAAGVTEHPGRDVSSLLLSRVDGVTYSHLVTGQCLTPGRLRALLGALKRLHAQPSDAPMPADSLLCANYASKVRSRFEKHGRAYEAIARGTGTDAAALFARVVAGLGEYEAQGRFQKSAYIHGDPVFSNVLLTHDATVKFLDMRGALGDTLTTGGDVAYDLSKVYQSLTGYDFIILDEPLADAHAATLRSLRAVFGAWLAAEYPKVRMRDVRMVVAAHYFCIVPLHEKLNHQRKFLYMAQKLLEEDTSGSYDDCSAAAAGP